MTPDLESLRALAEKATPGPWSYDGDEDEDGYGRYTSYRLYGETLSRDYDILADSINSTASTIRDERDGDGGTRYDETAQRNFAFIAAANPQTVLALLSRLQECEKALGAMTDAGNRMCATVIQGGDRDSRTSAAENLSDALRAAASYFQSRSKSEGGERG